MEHESLRPAVFGIRFCFFAVSHVPQNSADARREPRTPITASSSHRQLSTKLSCAGSYCPSRIASPPRALSFTLIPLVPSEPMLMLLNVPSALLVLLGIMGLIWSIARRNRRYPPGPTCRPFIGNLLSIPIKEAWNELSGLKETYGTYWYHGSQR